MWASHVHEKQPKRLRHSAPRTWNVDVTRDDTGGDNNLIKAL